VPALPRALRRAVITWVTAAGLPDAAVDDLQLAAGQAAANAAPALRHRRASTRA
jgi:hypothetical protein